MKEKLTKIVFFPVKFVVMLVRWFLHLLQYLSLMCSLNDNDLFSGTLRAWRRPERGTVVFQTHLAWIEVDETYPNKETGFFGPVPPWKFYSLKLWPKVKNPIDLMEKLEEKQEA